MESKSLELLQSIYAQQKFIVDRMREPDMAQLAVDKAERPRSIVRITLDLSQARDPLTPLRIGFPFKSIHFKKSTNPKSFINVMPETTDQHQDSFELGYNDGWRAGKIVQDAFLSWPAQTGQGTLIVYTDSEFVSGANISITEGGISISEGSSAILTNQAIPAAAASEILPQNFFRKTATVVNDTGDDIFLGENNTVNATTKKGVPIANGDSFKWRNSAALYAYSGGGGKIIILEET